MPYLIKPWLEKCGILLNYSPWYGLEASRRRVTVINKLCFMNMENNLESIYMEGEGHIFTFNLFFFWVNVPCRGLLHSVNGILKYCVVSDCEEVAY